MSKLPEKKQWPLKWVVLGIVLFIVPYTYLRLHFSRPGRAYEPYAEARSRATTAGLLSGGFQRIALTVHRPAGSPRGSAAAPAIGTTAGPGGMPAALQKALADPPL